MPGALVEIKVADLRPTRDRLNGLRDRMRDLTPVMRAIGEEILAGAQEAFISQTAPSGVPWEKSWRAVLKSGQTLRDRGILMNSLNVQEVTPNSVSVGTNVIYSAVHQFGAKQGEFGLRTVTVREHARKTSKGTQTVAEHDRMLAPGSATSF